MQKLAVELPLWGSVFLAVRQKKSSKISSNACRESSKQNNSLGLYDGFHDGTEFVVFDVCFCRLGSALYFSENRIYLIVCSLDSPFVQFPTNRMTPGFFA